MSSKFSSAPTSGGAPAAAGAAAPSAPVAGVAIVMPTMSKTHTVKNVAWSRHWQYDIDTFDCDNRDPALQCLDDIDQARAERRGRDADRNQYT